MKKSSTTRPSSRKAIARFEDIPNVGPAVAGDLPRLGITSSAELLGRDPYAMYDDHCRIFGQRHDPCLLDTFIAVVRYMAGEPKKPWWAYTTERKRELAARSASLRFQGAGRLERLIPAEGVNLPGDGDGRRCDG